MPRNKSSKRKTLKRSVGLKNLEEGLENIENDDPAEPAQTVTASNQQMAWVIDETENTTIPEIPSLEAGDFRRESTFTKSPSGPRRKPHISRTKTIRAEIEALSPIRHVSELASLSNVPSPARDRDDASSVSRLSADDSSIDGRSGAKPASRSYRDRIRDRIESVREKAVSSIVKSRAKAQSSRRLSLASRSEVDQTLREEESSVLEALERHEAARLRWKEAAAGSKEVASADAAFDFFTQVWDGDEQRPAEPTSPRSGVDEILAEEEGGKPTVSDLLGPRDEWETTEHTPATLLDEFELRQREDKLYFCVSAEPVELEKKLPPNCKLRDLAAEGLYVGDPPAVSQRNLRRLEQRLAVDGPHWFGPDGNVLRLADPRIEACEDLMPPRRSLKRAVVYCPALIERPSQRSPFTLRPSVLALHVESLRFSHHALFGREHVLARRLSELHRAYCLALEHRTVERLAGRLEALRRARDALAGHDAAERGKARYVQEIGKTRRSYQSEALACRELVKQLVSCWQDLVSLRERQGYVSTPTKMTLVTVAEPGVGLGGVGEEEWAAWNERIEKDVREVLGEQQERYNQELEEHTEERAAWSKRRKALRKKSRSGEGDGDMREEEPRPPAPPDVQEIRQQVTDTFYRCFAAPGEPEIRVELTEGEPVDGKIANNKEVQRRAAVKRTTVTLKILFNNVEVCRSKAYPIGAKFCVAFNQVMQIQIQQWPESLVVQVLVNSPGSQLSVEVFVPLPGQHTTLANAALEWLSFSSSQVQAASHAGVGSGVSFSELVDGQTKSTCLYTSGNLGCRVGWGVSATGEVMAPPDLHGDDNLDPMSSMLEGDGLMDVDKLSEWVARSQLDPNDPANAAFFHLLDTAPRSRREADCFRLDPLNREFDFCTDAEMEANPRLKLLRLRDQQEPEFRSLKLVPCLEREIDKDVFKKYNERLEAMPDTRTSEPLSLVDAHRSRGRRFLLEVRQRVLAQCRVAQQHRTLQDIVLEDQVLAISTLGLTFVKWLQPKRPLRPKRRERKKVAVQNLAGQEVKISVNVVRAFEVPVRKDADPVSSDGTNLPAFVPVRPFVEVSFQGAVARTTAADGANPTWNQDLQLPLRPPSGDFSAPRLQEIQESVYLHLFDETVVDLLEDDRMRETNVHQRMERNWLGSLSIPFSTLYHNSRIEGTFKMYSPPVLLGYEREPQHRRFNGHNIATDSPMQRDATFLTLFITVHPALNPPEPFKERLESSELEYVERHLDKWQADMAALFPRRPVKPLVLDSSGKTLCVTRFLRPLQPPVLDPEHETTEEMAARFVSMIPSVPGSVLFPGLFDVWLTSQQVLSLLAGDCQDLAALLCCYLSHLGVKAWLLLGAGIPHGPSAYVLTRTGSHRSEHEFFVWDPVAGQRYSLLDSFCPLRAVWCIVNEDNIWGNVQREESPRRTRFDLSSRADWWPAFGRAVAAPTGSVQLPALEYRPTSMLEAQRLQDKLEKHLRDSIARWRRTETTLWNRYCVAILRKMLPALEASALAGATASAASPAHAAELQHVLSSHKMCGFPINVPYTMVSAVTEAVKATGVHRNESPEVEFALAVHVHPYPNDVLSVWVYVAALVRRR